METPMSDDNVTPAEKLKHWLDFAEANRPGHDSLRDVSYEPAPIRQVWLADVLTSLAAERNRADRAERERDDAYLTIRSLTKAGA
jgi:hypothetical protein